MSSGFRRRARNPAEEVAEFKSKKGFTQKGVDDLVMLPKITEQEIVDNIKKRFTNDAIYTNIGPVLIVVNPYKDLGLTTDEYVRLYRGKFRHELPPHVFALAEETYRNMKSEKTDQCVIISGESGAGKTVAAKQIMQYIAAVSGRSEKVEYIKNVILDSNPLLEAFGNAKTLRNNNSSRFGKYFEIHFDTKGDPIGGKITNYLLEKSRVVYQQNGERNFHIFYQLVNGADDTLAQKLQLYTAENFHYMNQSGCLDVEGVDDTAEFQETLKSMRTMGMNQEDIDASLRIIAGILHLGNIAFQEDNKGNGAITDRNVLSLAADMLQVPVENLEYALLFRQITSGSGGRAETFEVALNPVQAVGARDALARELYDRLFTWLVEKVNQALSRWNLPHQCCIGILDIFGFEIFNHNGFEQFCINYVNEKLQQYFIELTLKAEQEEYIAEGIQWSPIKYFNNKIVCDLIEGRTPPGIFSLLDDVCATIHAMSEGTDAKFLQKVDAVQSSNQHYRSFTGAFAVKHYAGEVTYEVDGFCDKNKDTLYQECVDCMRVSKNPFIVKLFPITPEEQAPTAAKRRPTTAGFKIKTSANALMATLSQCSPHYIRCIKPNDVKKAGVWEQERVRHQVQYLGLLENVKVRRAGFAFRSPFDRFLVRYKKLSPKTWGMWGEWNGDPQEGCRVILEGLTTLEAGQWQFGKTKIFIRHPESVFHIEEKLERIDFDCTVKIQKAWRVWRARRKALEQRAEAADLLRGKKERQRNSGERKWLGDYVNYEENFELQDVMEPYKEEMVTFADNVLLLSSRSRLEKRVLLLTETGFYLICRVVKNKQGIWQITRRGELKNLSQISVSTMADNYVVLHMPSEHDCVIECDKKTEMIMLMRESFKEAVKRELNVIFSDNITYKAKAGEKDHVLQFIRDEAAIPLVQLQEQKKEKALGFFKNVVGTNLILKIGVQSGLQRDTDTTPKGYHMQVEASRRGPGAATAVTPAATAHAVTATPTASVKAATTPAATTTTTTKTPTATPQATATPAAATAPAMPARQMPKPPPKTTKPKARVLYDYDATTPDELTIREGDIIFIVQKDEGGWWEGEMNNKRGWVPANYVEEMH